MPFHWEQGVHLLQGKQQGQTRPPNGSTLAKKKTTRGVLHVFHRRNTRRRRLCPRVAMRVHFAVADTRSSSRMTLSSSLNGQPGAAKKKFLGTQKVPAQNPSARFSTGDEARSPSTRKASRAGAPANGSLRCEAQRHRAEAESAEESPSLQKRKARKLDKVTEKQHSCTLGSQKWATIDETPLENQRMRTTRRRQLTEDVSELTCGRKKLDSFAK